MKKIILIAIIALIVMAAFFSMSNKKDSVSQGGGEASAPSAIKPYVPLIKAELEKEGNAQLCINPPSGFFPDNEQYSCIGCERFVKMGLLELKRPLEPHETQDDARYKLTEKGKQIYVEKQSSGQKYGQFCLGKARFKQITEYASSIQNIDNKNYISGTFTLSVTDPDPVLYSAYLQQKDVRMSYDNHNSLDIKHGGNRRFVFPQNSTESLPELFTFELLPNNTIGSGNSMNDFAHEVAAFKERRLEDDELVRLGIKVSKAIDGEFEKRQTQVRNQQ